MRLRVQLPTRWVRIDLAGDVDAQIDEFLAARLLTGACQVVCVSDLGHR